MNHTFSNPGHTQAKPHHLMAEHGVPLGSPQPVNPASPQPHPETVQRLDRLEDMFQQVLERLPALAENKKSKRKGKTRDTTKDNSNPVQ